MWAERALRTPTGSNTFAGHALTLGNKALLTGRGKLVEVADLRLIGNVVLTEVAVPRMSHHDENEGVLAYDLEMPENSLIVAVSTKDDVMVASEETRLYPGDTVVIASDRDKVGEVRSLFRSL